MKAMGVVFSNLHDKNVPELTAARTLASVPFGGRYRLIDFVLSSLVNSDIEKVGIITKYNYQSLMDHVGSGKHWDLDRKNGGLIILPPYGAGDSMELYSNRLEALQGVLSFFKRSTEEFVVMSDCDNIANVNYLDVIDFHTRRNADITMIYRTKNMINDKPRNIMVMDSDGRVNKFYSATMLSGSYNVYSNMLVIKRDLLIRLLEQAAINGQRSFSRDIIAKSTNSLRIYGYKFEGYFASIDSLQNYYKHNLELLEPANKHSLFAVGSPIYTKIRDSAPTIYNTAASVSNCMIADGCTIEGTVINSVLFRGVKICKGAVVKDSILMQGTHIGANAELGCVVTDKNVVIKENRKLYGCEELPYFVAKNTNL